MSLRGLHQTLVVAFVSVESRTAEDRCLGEAAGNRKMARQGERTFLVMTKLVPKVWLVTMGDGVKSERAYRLPLLTGWPI